MLIAITFPFHAQPRLQIKGSSTAFKEFLQPRRFAIFL
jgi:hypothetical protein